MNINENDKTLFSNVVKKHSLRKEGLLSMLFKSNLVFLQDLIHVGGCTFGASGVLIYAKIYLQNYINFHKYTGDMKKVLAGPPPPSPF